MPRSRASTNIRHDHNTRIRSLIVLVAITFVGFCIINIYLVAHLDDEYHDVRSNDLSSAASALKPSITIISDSPLLYSNGTDDNKNKVIDYFRDAGVHLDDESLEELPTWSQIESLIGDKPILLGAERCEDFRDKVPPLRRMLGSSGMFNSGTNLVTRLMKENCVIPERYNEWGPKATKEQWGIRWQCPWGKHTPANYKYAHSAPLNENITKDDCLPIVTVRNPYDWMKSMCKHFYTARWNMHEAGIGNIICPHLVYHKTSTPDKMIPVELKVKLAEQWITHKSLAHLWNDWYAEYWQEANFPFLMVRFEDLIFRQHETTKLVCECAGGTIKPKNMFKYIVNSAKQGPGHGKDKTGMVEAWIRYGKPKEVKAGFSDRDWEASREYLSHDLMKKMGYKYPPSD